MTVLDLWNDPAVTVLATMRGLALLVAGPVFGHPALPMRVRVAFAMGLALAPAPPGLELASHAIASPNLGANSPGTCR